MEGLVAYMVQYRDMTDEALLEAAKYERASPALVKALAERLEDVLAEASVARYPTYDHDD